MPAPAGHTHPGGSQVRDVVAGSDLAALLRRPVALHLQFRGDAEGQSGAQPVEVGVDVGVDQAGQQGGAGAIHDRRSLGDGTAYRGDQLAVHNHGRRVGDVLAVEDSDVDDGGHHG